MADAASRMDISSWFDYLGMVSLKTLKSTTDFNHGKDDGLQSY